MNKHIKKQIRRFNKWMGYNPPGALTSKGWRLFNKEFKEIAPIRYYFHNEFKKTFIWPIKFKYIRISDWVRYRTYDRYHIIETGLKPDYYNIETQMLHANFNMLKDFIEVEQAWHSFWCSDKTVSWFERNMPFYYRFFPFRRPDFGVKHFEWAATLDDPSLPPHERSELQALQAKEILKLYRWWVNERLARKEVEYLPYNNQGFGTLGSLDDDFNEQAPDYIAHVKSMDDRDTQEQEWEKEDTEMLIRLIKIRKGLWS